MDGFSGIGPTGDRHLTGNFFPVWLAMVCAASIPGLVGDCLCLPFRMLSIGHCPLDCEMLEMSLGVVPWSCFGSIKFIKVNRKVSLGH